MMGEELELFRVVRDEERTRVDIDGRLMGFGVEFPSGLCVVDWNRQAYPEENRLDEPHYSQYGSIDDVEQGTGGTVEPLMSWEVTGP